MSSAGEPRTLTLRGVSPSFTRVPFVTSWPLVLPPPALSTVWRGPSAVLEKCLQRTDLKKVALPLADGPPVDCLCDMGLLASLCFRSLVRTVKNILFSYPEHLSEWETPPGLLVLF